MEVNDGILTNFHSDEYVELIKNIHPTNKHLYEDQLYRCKRKEYPKEGSFSFSYPAIFKETII